MNIFRRVLVSGSLLILVGACRSGVPTAEPSPHPQPKAGAAHAAPLFTLCRAGLPEAGNWKCNPVFADVNADGHLDLAATPRVGDGPHVWLGNGAGGWRDASDGLPLPNASCGGGVSFADINRDGHLDLALADHCQGTFVFLGDGAGHWQMVAQDLRPPAVAGQEPADVEPMGAEYLALGDVNSDGFIDLVTASATNQGLALYLGDGTGRNWTYAPGELPTTGWANRVALADINGDGMLDLLATYCEGPRVWLGNGRGGWRPCSEGLPTPSVKGLYQGLAVADMDADGRPELLAANWVDGPEIYALRADGRWQKAPDVFPAMLGGAYGVTAGDLDHDGQLELIVSGRLTLDVGFVYGVFLLHRDGRGGWTYVADSGLPATGLPFTWGIALGDIHGDGTLDIAAGSGGIVATSAAHAEPAIPAGLLLWCATPPPR